ncbi:MAG: hypothetical protein ABIU20_05095 [Blastocatellia bacterium]
MKLKSGYVQYAGPSRGDGRSHQLNKLFRRFRQKSQQNNPLLPPDRVERDA